DAHRLAVRRTPLHAADVGRLHLPPPVVVGGEHPDDAHQNRDARHRGNDVQHPLVAVGLVGSCYGKPSGQWSVVSGQWSVVSGQWSVVSKPFHWPLTTDHWPLLDVEENLRNINDVLQVDRPAEDHLYS